MPIYTVRWIEKVHRFASIEADTREEAIQKGKDGDYTNSDSEPGDIDMRTFSATEGEHGLCPVRRRKS